MTVRKNANAAAMASDELSVSKWPASEPGAALLREILGNAGALVAGRRLFDITDGWGDRHPIGAPVVVVTHRPVPDAERFPALRLSRDALRAGAGAPVVLNAANEVAVALFLERRLGFLDIAAVVEEALDLLGAPPVPGLDDVLALDARARREAMRMAARHAAA